MTDTTQNKLFTVHHLRVEDIDPDPDQPRSSLTGIDELAASIAAFGQLQPITVRATGNRYRIIGGERRWTATRQLGLETIAAFVAESDDAEVALIEMADNMHVPLTPDEISRGTQRAFTFDAPIERIVAATGAKLDVIERARRGFTAVSDPAVSETMSIEHLAALDEFADDQEAYDKLVAAPGKDWERIARDLRNARKTQEAYEACVEIVKASGAELVEGHASGRYYGIGTERPEGATRAVVRVQAWNGSADISWYGPAPSDEPDPEEQARAEARQAAYDALAAGHATRMGLIHDYVTALKHVAEDAWRARGNFKQGESWKHYAADARVLPEDWSLGFATDMGAAVLVALEKQVKDAFGIDSIAAWQVEGREKGLLEYIDALRSIGYEPDETTAARIDELRGMARPTRKKKEAAQ